MTKRAILLLVAIAAYGGLAAAQDITGDWQGTLDAGAMKLRLAVHVRKAADQSLTATLDSVDQNANGLPLTGVVLKDSTFVFRFDPGSISYEGRLSEDGGEIRGTFTQGQQMPLILRRGTVAPVRRPQTPSAPFTYRADDVVVENKTAGIRLAGTFTIPAGKGPFRSVVLATGSGPQDRDETIFGHKPFLVLADYLSRRGIAVLRLDDRGVGESGGNFDTATTADFATDIEAGIAWLQTRTEADHGKTGIIGHSEGGEIAPMVAARNPNVAFIVMLAGPGVKGDDVIVSQVIAENELSGIPHDVALANGEIERSILKIVETEKDSLKERTALASFIPPAQMDDALSQLNSDWYRFSLSNDPAADLRKVKVPVLALIGSKDTQVSSKQNLPAIRAALDAAGNKTYEVTEMPGLNHLFQHAITGAVSEYSTIEETTSPEVLEKVATWINAR